MTDIEHLARLNELENRIMKLEVKQGKIVKVLKLLEKWIIAKDAVMDGDTKLFDNINKRLQILEDNVIKP